MTVALLETADVLGSNIKFAARKIYARPVIEWARAYRALRKDVLFVGVTGSSGKTTTKELAHTVLSARYIAHKNDDTNNSTYSVANTLLRSPKGMQVLVQEIGASAEKDLNDAVRLLRPRIGVVLNIGQEHFKSFRTPEAVAAEKVKLVRGLSPGGAALLNADDPMVMNMASAAPCAVTTFGTSSDSDLRATEVEARWPSRLSMTLCYRDKRAHCETQLCGEIFVHSVLAAVAVGLACGMHLEDAAQAIASCPPFPGRMMPVDTSAGITILRDDWKAPYYSIAEPLTYLKNAKAKRKVAIIGTLSDYGGTSYKKYVNVAELALECADRVIFVGPNARHAKKVTRIPAGKSLENYHTIEDVVIEMRNGLVPGDLVLIKGSGADHLARLALMYQRDVKCWREVCKRERLCDNCRLLSIAE